MILYMYIAQGQGLTTPLGLDLSLWSFVSSSIKISLNSDFTHFFMFFFYIYIVLGQGQTAPWGQSFDVNRNVLSLHSFVSSFKKMSLKSDFIHFFTI